MGMSLRAGRGDSVGNVLEVSAAHCRGLCEGDLQVAAWVPTTAKAVAMSRSDRCPR